MAFHVGQKVVCIVPWFNWIGDDIDTIRSIIQPELGRTYTVRRVTYKEAHTSDGSPYSLLLREIRNQKINTLLDGATEPRFDSYGFRHAVQNERKTSIEIFKKLLHPSPAYSKDMCGND